MTVKPNEDKSNSNSSENPAPETYRVGYVDLLANEPSGVHWLEGSFTLEDAKAQVEAANAAERQAERLVEWRFQRNRGNLN